MVGDCTYLSTEYSSLSRNTPSSYLWLAPNLDSRLGEKVGKHTLHIEIKASTPVPLPYLLLRDLNWRFVFQAPHRDTAPNIDASVNIGLVGNKLRVLWS